MRSVSSTNFDVAVVGNGLTGPTVALHLADHRRMVVTSKRSLSKDASDWAQGGIAAMLDSGGNHDEHVDDALIAGVGLYDKATTCYIVENGRSTTEWLIDHGVPLARNEQVELGFHLTREGGHRYRRIVHAADATGHAMAMTLAEKVYNHPNITLLEDHLAIDLTIDTKLGRPGMRCRGFYALDIAPGHTKTITASRTMMATGGAGKVCLYVTNPDTANDGGIAMAW